jgi:hypothetical protein
MALAKVRQKDITLSFRTPTTITMFPRSLLRFAGIVSAAAGAALGYWGVGVIATQGFHAIVLPAGLPGILAGAVSKERSVGWALAYGLAGCATALFTEWTYRPFVIDPSLVYFIQHVDDLQPMVLVIITVGAIIGGVLSISFGRNDREHPKPQNA